jgi:hypothetical protein
MFYLWSRREKDLLESAWSRCSTLGHSVREMWKGILEMTENELISDEEIERVHGNANFGGMDKREVVRLGVLKCASGYYQGHTSKTICIEHGLITKDTYELTPKGKYYLWAAFSNGSNF